MRTVSHPPEGVTAEAYAAAITDVARTFLSMGFSSARVREHAPAFGDEAAGLVEVADAMDALDAGGFDAEAFRASRAAGAATAKAEAGSALPPDAARATAGQLLAEGRTAASVRADAGDPRWQCIRGVLVSVADAMDQTTGSGR